MADQEEAAGAPAAAPAAGHIAPMEPGHGPLISVSFQRNSTRNQKYLEAQPKTLGITQIGLSIYQIPWPCLIDSHHAASFAGFVRIPFIVSCIVVMIAGCLAIAAKTLHIPTLKASLVLQVFAIMASVFNILLVGLHFENFEYCSYYPYSYHNKTSDQTMLCGKLKNAYSHYSGGAMLVQLTLLAVSVTLAAYSCKVVNCCSPSSRMPVITVHAPSQAPPPTLE
ncbi:hypothetical protein NHX12_014195 [Muraenolepis orangiensis]|uniref:Membrane-spanning 4-domains subfamily A member 4A n=1 Tax=Muraenolepis orangiensis TaxID=630683 RepID=A0A9Q0I6L6_9TELE|nr:hypothetical protein NHX12_014195 [Muraenolepis orangiensis]